MRYRFYDRHNAHGSIGKVRCRDDGLLQGTELIADFLEFLLRDAGGYDARTCLVCQPVIAAQQAADHDGMVAAGQPFGHLYLQSLNG